MKYFKNLIIGALVLCVIFLVGRSFFSRPLKTENNVADFITLDKSKSIEYKDTIGRNHTSKEVVRVPDESKALIYKQQLDSVKKQLGIAEDKIRGITTATVKGEYTFIPDLKNIEDSLRRVIGTQVQYKTKWISIDGSTIPNTPWKVRTMDSLTLLFHAKVKKGLFKQKEILTADLYSENKDVEYLNVRSWQVPETSNNKTKWGFGITAGPGLSVNNKQVNFQWLQVTGGIQFRF